MIIKDGVKYYSLDEAAEMLDTNVRWIRHQIYNTKTMKRELIGNTAFIEEVVIEQTYQRLKNEESRFILLNDTLRTMIRRARIAKGLTYEKFGELINRNAYQLERKIQKLPKDDWEKIKAVLEIE